jgi:hypothetical protein
VFAGAGAPLCRGLLWVSFCARCVPAEGGGGAFAQAPAAAGEAGPRPPSSGAACAAEGGGVPPRGGAGVPVGAKKKSVLRLPGKRKSVFFPRCPKGWVGGRGVGVAWCGV